MRLKQVRNCYFILIFLVILRLFYWQVIRSDDLVAKAEEQRVKTQEIIAQRGDILFADGSVLASVQPSFLLYGQPKVLNNKELVAHQLADILWMEDFGRDEQLTRDRLKDPNDASASADLVKFEDNKNKQTEQIALDVLGKLSQNLYWVQLRKKISLEAKNKITSLNITGIGFEPFSSRLYPEGSSAAHLLGFVGSDSFGNDTGYFGVEGYYNGELRGKNGLITQENDARGSPILIGKYISKEPKPGKTLVLNIDRVIQYIVEEKLKQGLEKYGAKQASAIVMDPKTGNILAMAAYPNYDPAIPEKFPKEVFHNPLTADAYEPGSTFKVVVMAAAINEGKVKPDAICDSCAGPVSIGNYLIRTWNNQYMNNQTMTDVIIHSDNTGMVFVAKKIGVDTLYSYLSNFGFGKPSGVDLQDEQSPSLRPKDSWKDIDLATASFGQGISVSAIQLIKAVGAIANGGKLMEPHVVAEVRDGDNVSKIPPKELAKPIKSETAQTITTMMVRAVEEGEAKFFKLNGYSVAGKTGTAQIPLAGHYDSDKTVASFVGFAPANDPKFIMLVRYDQPTSSIYGAETAAPTFFQIAKELFNYYNIPPDH